MIILPQTESKKKLEFKEKAIKYMTTQSEENSLEDPFTYYNTACNTPYLKTLTTQKNISPGVLTTRMENLKDIDCGLHAN